MRCCGVAAYTHSLDVPQTECSSPLFREWLACADQRLGERLRVVWETPEAEGGTGEYLAGKLLPGYHFEDGS